MNYITINKFSNIPLYLQLKNGIKNAILNGTLKDKDQLPTEYALCDVFNISRPVVRQAYVELINEGLIKRVQGKGTFVHREMIFTNLPYNTNYEKLINELGFKPESYQLSFEIIEKEDIPYGIREMDSNVYCIKRIRKASHIPVYLEYFYVPQNKFPNFDEIYQENIGLTKALMSYYPEVKYVVETSINVVVLDDSLADILEVQRKSACFRYFMNMMDEKGDTYYSRISYFPGERHILEIIAKEKDDVK